MDGNTGQSGRCATSGDLSALRRAGCPNIRLSRITMVIRSRMKHEPLPDDADRIEPAESVMRRGTDRGSPLPWEASLDVEDAGCSPL